MDHTLAGVSRKLPEALSRILLLPFCSQVAALLQRLAGSGTAPGMAELVGAFPFLFPLVAGERAEELSRQLLLAHPEATAGLNLAQIKSQIASGRFEENLVLLNRMRPMLREKFEEDDDFDGPFPFFSGGFGNDSDRELREVFRALYDRVLNDVAVQAKDLAPRDSKELRRVMEKVLIDDLPFLVDDPGDVKELAPLLQRLIGAGCAGKRLALLTLLVARRNRSAALRSAAEKVLDQSPPVDEQDLKWLLLEFDAIYFPRLTALAPLLDRFRGDPALFSLIFLTIFGKTEDLIEIRTFTTERRGLLSSLLEMGELDLTEDFHTLRRELDELKSYQEMDAVRVYVSCFPRGCYTREGFLRWLDHVHGTDKWPNFLKGQLQTLSRKREKAAGLPFGAGGGIQRFIDEQFNAILHHLKEHADDFRTMEVAVIQELVEVMAQFKKALQLDPTFLIRVSNILGERAGAGENAAGPLQNELLELLRQLATPKPKARQSRRKRR